ncbi:MAG: regulatory protein RecX [Candidatus Omnitrophica bacterium]|nr:regulatory protein RecX [Candidatus Omnitrophota bacterium]
MGNKQSGKNPDGDAGRARNYALLLLKYRPRSSKELYERLVRKGFDSDLARRFIDDWTAKGLVDDKEFARWWVKNRLSTKPRGKALLRVELRLKGVGSDEIEEALKDAFAEDDSDYHLAKEVALRKTKRATNFYDIKSRRRLFTYLIRRGFTMDVSNRVIRELINENEE